MQHVCSRRLCFHVNQDCNLILFFTNINLRQDHAVKLGKLSSLWVRKKSMQHVCSQRLCFHVNQDCNLILFFTNINLRQDHAVKLGKLSSLWVRKNSNIPPAIQPTYSAGESIENSSFDLKGCASQQIYTKNYIFFMD